MSAPPAYVTVTDAAGRVLFRRPATQAEIEEAIQVADAADAEAQAVLKRIAEERQIAMAAAQQQQALPPVAPPEPEARSDPEAEEPAEPEPVFTSKAMEAEDEEPAIRSGDENFDFLSELEKQGER